MNELNKLIQTYCPNGVPFFGLGELGKFYGGLTGKSKNDFINGNEKFITYKNVYSNPALKIDVEDRVKIAPDENQRTLEYGDVIFTGSSENLVECGLSSVLTEKTNEKLYLNSFCFVFRFNDLSCILPEFAKHLFRSNTLRYQIGKTASGVTRFNVSKKLMEKVVIPVPPIEVQAEIVRILDNFMELTAELTTKLMLELDMRKKQYKYYRKSMFTFDDSVQMIAIGDVCDVVTGGEAPPDCIKGEISDEQHPYAVWGNGKEIYGYSGTYRIDKDSVVISSIGANTGTVYFRRAFFTPIIRLKVVIPKDDSLDIRYLFHALSVTGIKSKSSSVPNMNANEIKKIKIPLPELHVQKRIATILDCYDMLCDDISDRLPAEIEARQLQYAYYRDTLLDFKRLGGA